MATKLLTNVNLIKFVFKWSDVQNGSATSFTISLRSQGNDGSLSQRLHCSITSKDALKRNASSKQRRSSLDRICSRCFQLITLSLLDKIQNITLLPNWYQWIARKYKNRLFVLHGSTKNNRKKYDKYRPGQEYRTTFDNLSVCMLHCQKRKINSPKKL